MNERDLDEQERFIRIRAMSDELKFLAALCMAQPDNTLTITDRDLMNVELGGTFTMYRHEMSMKYQLEYRPPGDIDIKP